MKNLSFDPEVKSILTDMANTTGILVALKSMMESDRFELLEIQGWKPNPYYEPNYIQEGFPAPEAFSQVPTGSKYFHANSCTTESSRTAYNALCKKFVEDLNQLYMNQLQEINTKLKELL